MFEKGYISRRDIFVIILLLAISFGVFACWAIGNSKSGSQIRIEQRGRLVGIYNLKEDQQIPIRDVNGQEINRVTIAGGKAYMSEANCKDQLCVKQGKIEKQGQSIVCLPNRVIVTVIQGERDSLDSVVK